MKEFLKLLGGLLFLVVIFLIAILIAEIQNRYYCANTNIGEVNWSRCERYFR